MQLFTARYFFLAMKEHIKEGLEQGMLRWRPELLKCDYSSLYRAEWLWSIAAGTLTWPYPLEKGEKVAWMLGVMRQWWKLQETNKPPPPSHVKVVCRALLATKTGLFFLCVCVVLIFMLGLKLIIPTTLQPSWASIIGFTLYDSVPPHPFPVVNSPRSR